MRDQTGMGRANRVSSLMRGLAILQMFEDAGQTVTVSQIARRLGIHRSNASRLAATLCDQGFLSRTGSPGRYRLGPQLPRLARLAGEPDEAVRRAREPLRRLVDTTGETGQVAVLDGTEVVTAVVVDGWHTVRAHTVERARFPAHCTALGKALLSGLDDEYVRARFGSQTLAGRTPRSITCLDRLCRELDVVRRRGYAVDDEEYEPGLRCVAAPVRDADGRVVASLGLSGPVARLTDEVLQRLATAVRAAAAAAGPPCRRPGSSPAVTGRP